MAKPSRKSRPLGERVRQLRGDSGVTLSELSKHCGISVSTLSKLENGQTGLSLDNVIRLAASFDLPVSILLNESGPATGAVSVSRTHGPYDHSVPTMDFKVMHDDLPGQRNIFWKVRIKARSMEDFGPYHGHPGEEFFYVLSGRVRLMLEGHDPVVLQTGDSAQFDSSIRHAYLREGRSHALILMSNTITDMKLAGYVDGKPTGPRGPRGNSR